MTLEEHKQKRCGKPLSNLPDEMVWNGNGGYFTCTVPRVAVAAALFSNPCSCAAPKQLDIATSLQRPDCSVFFLGPVISKYSHAKTDKIPGIAIYTH